MKKFYSILVALLMVISLAGCSKNDVTPVKCLACSTENPQGSSFCSTCGTAINADNAPDVTDPSSDSIVPTSDSLDLSLYVGTWATEGISYENGGMILDIQHDGSTYTFDFSNIQSAPACRFAWVLLPILESNIDGNTVTADFVDEAWGYSGTLVVEFAETSLKCTVKDTKYIWEDDGNIWGFFDCEVKMVKNGNAFDAIAYPEENISFPSPEEQQTTDDPTNMTIDEMKQNCLIFRWGSSCNFSSESTVSYISRFDLLDNPDLYVNQLLVPCETLTEFVVCPDCQGSGFRLGIADKGKCNSRGYHSIEKTENNIHYILQQYPDQVMPKVICIEEINVDVNGTTIYEYKYDEGLIWTDYIYDLRENPSIPITENTTFVPYMIFLGRVGDSLKFGMFDCDIIENRQSVPEHTEASKNNSEPTDEEVQAAIDALNAMNPSSVSS